MKVDGYFVYEYMLNCSLVSYMVYRWLFLHLFSSVARTRLRSTAATYGSTVEIPSDWWLEQPGVEISIKGYHYCENVARCTGKYFSVEEEEGKMMLKLWSLDCHRPYLSVTMESQSHAHYVKLFQIYCKYAWYVLGNTEWGLRDVIL